MASNGDLEPWSSEAADLPVCVHAFEKARCERGCHVLLTFHKGKAIRFERVGPGANPLVDLDSCHGLVRIERCL